MMYGAYGANLNVSNMEVRCPQAKPMISFMLHGYKLVFNGVADIIKSKGSKVPIGLWEITEDCEKSLDSFEGFPYLYKKSISILIFLEQRESACSMSCVEKGMPFLRLFTTTVLLKDMKILV